MLFNILHYKSKKWQTKNFFLRRIKRKLINFHLITIWSLYNLNIRIFTVNTSMWIILIGKVNGSKTSVLLVSWGIYGSSLLGKALWKLLLWRSAWELSPCSNDSRLVILDYKLSLLDLFLSDVRFTIDTSVDWLIILLVLQHISKLLWSWKQKIKIVFQIEIIWFPNDFLHVLICCIGRIALYQSFKSINLLKFRVFHFFNHFNVIVEHLPWSFLLLTLFTIAIINLFLHNSFKLVLKWTKIRLFHGANNMKHFSN